MRINLILNYRHCEERSNLYIGWSTLQIPLHSIEIASFLAMTLSENNCYYLYPFAFRLNLLPLPTY